MANEISVTAQLQYSNPALSIPAKLLALTNALFNIVGKNYSQGSVSVPTSAAAIPISSLASAGWAMFINRDPTNYVTLLTGTGGTAFARLLPGEPALFRFDPTVTAPAWQAHTAVCEVEMFILEI